MDIKLMTQADGNSLSNLVLPPNNELIVDDLGKPSVMVKIPKFTYADLGLLGSGTHPAFIVNGKEVPYIYISKYQNIVENGRAYSLPYQRPHHTVNFDEAKAFCEAKGKGWHLMSNAEWAAIALWCKKHDCMPYGNNNYDYGDYYNTTDKGAPMPEKVYWDPSNPNEDECDLIPYTATGSGPKNWFHNNDFSGIADLNGNVYEWVSGVRVNAGELQVIPNNDSAMGVDESATSELWKAISQAGAYVAPGTSGAIKFGSTGINTSGTFKDATAASGVTIPALVKALALFPNDAADTYRDDYYYVSTSGERLFCRGGYCYDNDGAGVFFCYGYSGRSTAFDCLGFRSAFVEL